MEKKKYQILLVEDNKFDQLALKRFVEKNNLPYEIETASSISECKEALNSKTFDVILQDFQLKDGTAFDVLNLNLKEPVIIITGLGNEEIAVNCMKANAYDYIIKDPESNYLKLLPSIIENVIQRKKVEEQLKLIKHSIDNASESIIWLSPSGEIIFANKYSFKELGYSEKELLTTKWHNICPEFTEEKFKGFVNTLKRKGHLSFESSYRKKDGETYPVNIHVDYQIFGKKEVIFVSAHNITEQKNIEQERQKIQKLESIAILTGGIANNFEKFLKDITLNVKLAITKSGNNEELINILKEVQETVNLAKDLTKKLSTFASGGAPNKEITKISEIIKEETESNLRGSTVKLLYNFPEDIWKVSVDKNQFRQVINNLLNNAKEAMPEGGIIKINLENTTVEKDSNLPLKEGKYVKITIKDNGLGIAKKHLPRIFEPYFTTKQKGSGLGLSLVYSIIQKHDGYIGVDSKLGEGTTFYIYLPVA
ncbi:MAG: ATP-binding protein [candidate division WOR-3 bacterium]